MSFVWLLRWVALTITLLLVPQNVAVAQTTMVQVGAYSSLSEARLGADELESLDIMALDPYDILLVEAELGGSIWYRLNIGPFVDTESAACVCETLKQEGLECFLTEPPSSIVLADTRLRKLTLNESLPFGAEGAGQRAGASQLSSGSAARKREAPVFSDDQIEEYRRAAEHGNAAAQFALARILDEGRGVPEDNLAAVFWYREAARRGYGKAQHNLGAMYGNGEGVAVDLVRAYVWFSVANDSLSEEESEHARTNLAIAAQSLTPEDRSRAAVMVSNCRVSDYAWCEEEHAR